MPANYKKGLYRVNFSLTGFAKTFRSDNSLSPFTPERTALIKFSHFLANQKISVENPTTFVTVPEFRGLDYVGYIIEKERLNKVNGTWDRIEEFRIIGSSAVSYKDSRVAYGEVYRYRIRSILKHTTYKQSSSATNNEIVQELIYISEQQIRESLELNSYLFNRLTADGASAFGKGSTPTIPVKLGSNISVKLDPNNPPKFRFDLKDVEQQKKLISLYGYMDELQTTLASAGVFSDQALATVKNKFKELGVDVPEQPKVYASEYLVSYPSRNWQYVTITEKVLPPPPSTIKVVPCSPKKSIMLYWIAPVNDQRDLASFNLYRRTKVGEAWTLLWKDFPLNKIMYTDTDVEFGKKYIYALTTRDKHGYESFLSSQIQAELNSSFEFEKIENPLYWISGPGVRPEEINMIFKKFYDEPEQLIAKEKIKITASKTYDEDDTKLIIKLKSLDTHETQELVVYLNNKNVTEI
jgi:hypothetical protein